MLNLSNQNIMQSVKMNSDRYYLHFKENAQKKGL